MYRYMLSILAALLLAGLGIAAYSQQGGRQQQQPGGGGQTMGQQQMAGQQACPVDLKRLRMSIDEDKDGIELQMWLTDPQKGEVELLQQRARLLAERQRAATQRGAAESEGMAGRPMPGTLSSVPAEVEYDDEDDGAELKIRPKNETQRAMLRSQIWQQAANLAAGDCSLLTAQPGQYQQQQQQMQQQQQQQQPRTR